MKMISKVIVGNSVVDYCYISRVSELTSSLFERFHWIPIQSVRLNCSVSFGSVIERVVCAISYDVALD